MPQGMTFAHRLGMIVIWSRSAIFAALTIFGANWKLAYAQSQTGCFGSPIPAGWALVNFYWQPGQCGATGGMIAQGAANMQVVQKIAEAPVGSAINVCAVFPVPVGWMETNRFWDPTRCVGYMAAAGGGQNVKGIKRIQ